MCACRVTGCKGGGPDPAYMSNSLMSISHTISEVPREVAKNAYLWRTTLRACKQSMMTGITQRWKPSPRCMLPGVANRI